MSREVRTDSRRRRDLYVSSNGEPISKTQCVFHEGEEDGGNKEEKTRDKVVAGANRTGCVHSMSLGSESDVCCLSKKVNDHNSPRAHVPMCPCVP